MKDPITPDTQYHDLVAEAVMAAIQGQDFEPRVAQISEFFKANTVEGAGSAYMVIEPGDVGLTVGQIAEHVDANDAENFVDAMFRQQFTMLDAEQRQDLAVLGDELISSAVKAMVNTMEFGYGEPGLMQGPDAPEMQRQQVRRSGPR